jgi:nitroreductase
MDLNKSLQWRYATKVFNPDMTLDEKTLNYLQDAIRLSPSSYGLQPYRVLIIRNKEIQQQLVPATYHQKQVSDASDVFVFCSISPEESMVDEYLKQVKKLRNTPPEKLEAFREMILNKIQSLGKEGAIEWIARQSYIAMTHLLIACAEQQIDACPIEGFIPGEYSRILGLEKIGLEPILVVPVGYRDESDPYAHIPKVRKENKDLFIHL